MIELLSDTNYLYFIIILIGIGIFTFGSSIYKMLYLIVTPFAYLLLARYFHFLSEISDDYSLFFIAGLVSLHPILLGKEKKIASLIPIILLPLLFRFRFLDNWLVVLLYWCTFKLYTWSLSRPANIQQKRLTFLRYKSDILKLLLFIMFIVFYSLATRSFDIKPHRVENYVFYSLSLFFMLIFIFFNNAAIFFSSFRKYLYHENISIIFWELTFDLFILNSKIIKDFNLELYDADPSFQEGVIALLKILVPLSITFHLISALGKKNKKQFMTSILFSQLNFHLLCLIVARNNSVFSELNFYLFSLLIPYLVLYSAFDNYNPGSPNRILECNFRGLFYKERFISILIIICLLSIIGIPFTIGFSSKFFLVVNYVQEKLTTQVALMLISSIFVLPGSINLISNLFDKNAENENTYYMPTSLGKKWAYALLVILIVFFGIYPKLLI